MTKSHSEVKGLLIAFLAALVLLAALFPLAQAADKRDDRKRPMYRDVLTMASLQYSRFQRRGHVRPMELRGGETADIDGHRFTPSAGVTVWVKVSGDGFCVRGRNRHGDVTKWQCADHDTEPIPVGSLAKKTT